MTVTFLTCQNADCYIFNLSTTATSLYFTVKQLPPLYSSLFVDFLVLFYYNLLLYFIFYLNNSHLPITLLMLCCFTSPLNNSHFPITATFLICKSCFTKYLTFQPAIPPYSSLLISQSCFKTCLQQPFPITANLSKNGVLL